MKKKLESELISIAHRILKLKGKEDVDRMHEEVAKLYEKLTVLKFAQENFEDDMPTIGNDSSFFDMLDTAFNNTVSDTVEIDNKVYVNVDEREEDEIAEPAIEKIKDIVAQMPSETHQVDAMIEEVATKTVTFTTELEDLAKDYQELPIFERVSENEENKSLNERLKGNQLNIGLNDRIAFIKHLFGGSDKDYHRVISQLNTVANLKDAENFIQSVIKPDYNDWYGKEEYEERFMEIISSKFQ
ncbi:MAG: hypothetical protein ACWA5P_10020 [bacterium]